MGASEGLRAGVLFIVVVAGGSLVACKKPQTFEEAMRVACEYPDQPDVKARIDRLPEDQRARALVQEAKERITNPEAKALLFGVAPSRAEGEANIKNAVKRAGISHCWITDPALTP
jgi:hypothetical protein